MHLVCTLTAHVLRERGLTALTVSHVSYCVWCVLLGQMEGHWQQLVDETTLSSCSELLGRSSTAREPLQSIRERERERERERLVLLHLCRLIFSFTRGLVCLSILRYIHNSLALSLTHTLTHSHTYTLPHTHTHTRTQWVMEHSHLSSELFTLYLHQNYLNMYNEIENVVSINYVHTHCVCV